MKKGGISVIILFLLMMSVGIVCANENTTSQDIVSSADVSGNSFDDIQKSVDACAEKDTVKLNGTYSGDKYIKVSKSLIFESKDTTPAVLDGKNTTGIFRIESGDVTFKNIIFKNGVSNQGGAVYNLGKCVFINCSFLNDYAGQGGAIYTKSDLTLNNCRFESCHADMGGAVACYNVIKKDTSKSKYGDLTVEDSVFTGCSAKNGGALYIELDGNLKDNRKYATVNIKNSRFISNNATDFGGAIQYSGRYNGKVTIDKSVFSKNCADEGSACDISEAKLTLTNTEFSKNTGYYAALYISFGTDASIKKCSFTDNSAEAVSSFISYNSKASIVDCTFKSNSVAAISSYSDSALTITNGKSTKTYKKQVVMDNSFKSVVTLKVKSNNLLSKYNSRDKFTIQLINKNTKRPIKFFSINIHFKNGKKVKTFIRTTDSNGKVTLRLYYNINVAKYTVTYSSDNDWGVIDGSKHKVTIKKAKADVKAPKITAKHKKSAKFKITIKDKTDYRPYGVKMKIKVFTGKKAKTYTLKTNYNGVAKLNTKQLSKGTHKVVIKSADKNYKFSAKSSIKIK